MAEKKPFFDNQTYDNLKKSVMVGLPTLVTFYIAIAGIWGLPYAEQIAGTLTALTAVLGAMLRKSSKNYDESDDKYAGTIDISTKPDGRQNVLFGFKDDEVAENLDKRDSVTFKINMV